MFCKSCGANIPDGQAVCPSCGAAQTGASAPTPAPTSSSPMGGFDPQKLIGQFKPSGKAPNFISLGGAVLALICLFLPFISVSTFGISVSTSLWSSSFSDCVLVIIGALVAGGCAYIANHIGTMVGGAIIIAAAFLKSRAGKYAGLVEVNKKIGFWLLLVAGIVIIGWAAYLMLQEKNGKTK